MEKFDWKAVWCVQPNNIIKDAYEKAELIKNEFPAKYKKFNRSIWKHLENNLQVRIILSILKFKDDATFTWKMHVRRELLSRIKCVDEKANLLVTGSTVNGCGSYNCDMDLCVSIPEEEEAIDVDGYTRKETLATLNKIKAEIAKSPIIRRVIIIKAKVPILKMWFEEPFDHLEVDMNFNNLPVVHFLQVASDPPILPNLQKLFPAFFAYKRPLCELSLFCDLPDELPVVPKNTKTIGELLIGFFEYYNRFDFKKYGISIARGCVFPRDELLMYNGYFKVYIEEPFDKQNTARCVTQNDKFEHIKKQFRKAAKHLNNTKKVGSLRDLGIRKKK